ncbi:prefoldin subunit, putative [Perkinsus marinus ATCC 50983]|uniref:Prefoldin subunit, putative n=1 Tax=Perkinsus marinus (strain ATCC 50983 / TXsc) TaxID=423536 RepID=C5L1G3_PERM5|nr:prefoldin subunit, putative [Perkinsus marinus ATCC 50983]EER09390.1 prefoldin subunit, putative [Perkinsus marinus ATCC 50983]|eukprot:XP_002777574.1 prefoldin subunit, putative [Perkinsus marinus ATCC 50983]
MATTTTAVASSTKGEGMTAKEVQTKVQQLDRERSAIVSKIAELEQESKEHGLVLGAFDKVPEDRRCYRLVGGVLVERTVKDFRPVVEDNKARMDEALKSLSDMLSEKTKAMEEIIEKYGTPGLTAASNVEGKRGEEEKADEGAKSAAPSAGVLV